MALKEMERDDFQEILPQKSVLLKIETELFGRVEELRALAKKQANELL